MASAGSKTGKARGACLSSRSEHGMRSMLQRPSGPAETSGAFDLDHWLKGRIQSVAGLSRQGRQPSIHASRFGNELIAWENDLAPWAAHGVVRGCAQRTSCGHTARLSRERALVMPRMAALCARWTGVERRVGCKRLLSAFPIAVASQDRLLNPPDPEVSIGGQPGPQPYHEEPAKPPTPGT